MELKDFLEKGGVLQYPYKACLKDWYSNLTLLIYNGKVALDLVTRHESMPIEKLDEAIEIYISIAMSKDNIHHIQKQLVEKYKLDDLTGDENFLIEEMKELGYTDEQIGLVRKTVF